MAEDDGGPLSGAGESEVLTGVAGSHGVAVAPAVVFGHRRGGHPQRRVASDRKPQEWNRFVDAVCDVQGELRGMAADIPEGRPEASILDAYLLMVGDELLARRVHAEIHDAGRCAEWAVAASAEAMALELGGVGDPYLRERSHDVEFVGELLLRALAGGRDSERPSIEDRAIVVAHDLSPADTVAMLRSPVAGFVTEIGSRTSHTAIMARALAIPAVLGVREALARIAAGDELVVDGLRGCVIVHPSEEQLDEAHRRSARYQAMAEKLGESRDRPAVTSDGVRIALHANIELPGEAPVARAHGAEGVGLYRTEFLYVARNSAPSEDDQFEAFVSVVRSMGGATVTLRTFDLGGDKFTSSFELPEQLNPLLGLRAVRLALSEPEVFLTQLRAMVRASAHGPVRIMVPMVTTVAELREVRALVAAAREHVRLRGEPMAAEIPIGAMIEVPAAAVMADVFAREADFLSIGTNDLVQYSLAIDRSSRSLAHLGSPFEPAILRLLAGVVRAAGIHGCPVSLCGEMASEPLGALLCAGLGLRELSMESVAIPEVKEAIARANMAELEQLAFHSLEKTSAAEVEELIYGALEPRLRDLLQGQPASTPGSYGPRSSEPRAVPRSRGSDPARGGSSR
jgi:phosphotransferase system enzyme I (PtsI)